MLQIKSIRLTFSIVLLFYLFPFNLLATSKEWSFSDKTSEIILPEIYLNFEKLGISFKKGDNLYLQIISEKGYTNGPIWDKNKYLKDFRYRIKNKSIRPYLIEINTPWGIIADKIHIPWIRTIFKGLKGPSYNKFTREVFFPRNKNKDTVIGFPVQENVTKSDRLRILMLPVKLNGVTVAKIKISKDKKNWKYLDYSIKVGHSSLDIDKTYYFIRNDTIEYSIGLKILTNKPSVIRSNFPIRFTLPETAPIIWGSDINSGSVKGKQNEDIKGTITKVNDKILEWLPLEKITDQTTVLFSNLKILGTGTKDDIRIGLDLAYTNSKGSGIFRYEWIKVAESSNKICLVAPYFKIEGGNDFTIYSMTEEFKLPTLIIGEGATKFFTTNMNFEIVLPENIPITWDKQKINKNGIDIDKLNNSVLEVSDKLLRFNIKSRSIKDEIKLNDLYISRPKTSILPFDVKLQIAMLDQKNEIINSNKIVIGQPSFYLANDQLILTTILEPKINRMVFVEDRFVNTLKRGDRIIYSFPENSKFQIDKNKLLLNAIIPDNIFRIINERGSSSLVLEILETPGLGNRYYIENIPLIPSSESIKKTHGTFTINSPTGSNFHVLDNNSIEMAKLTIKLFSSKEYIRDIDKNIQRFILPNIVIRNDGYSPVLKNETIKIALAGLHNYRFIAKNILVISSRGEFPVDIFVENENLQVTLREDLISGGELIIKRLNIELPNEYNNFKDVPITARIGTEKTLLRSNETITYGAPVLRSAMQQVLYRGSYRSEFYTLEVNFGNLSRTLDEIDELILLLPEESPLQWSNEMNISFTGPAANSLSSERYRVFNNGKKLKLPVSSGNEFTGNKKLVFIHGLKYQDINSDITSEYKIKLTINGGETYCAEDQMSKRIVSQANAAAIDHQRVLENWYPFKKGNIVKLSLLDSSPVEWDTTSSLRYSVRDVKLNRTKIFNEKLRFLDNNKEIILTIQHDVDDVSVKELYKGISYQMMDYGEDVTFEGFKINNWSTKEITDSFIGVTLKTLFGDKTYYHSDKYIKYEVKSSNGSTQITLGLNSFPVDDKLNDRSLVKWYRNPGQYLPFIGLQEGVLRSLTESDKERDLETLRNTLEWRFNVSKEDIYYDWVFWYYLSWYKKRWRELKGITFPFLLSEERLNESSYNDDFNIAQKMGWDNTYQSKFPNPIDEDKYTIQEVIKYSYKEAVSLINTKRYLEAEDILLDILNNKHPDMENWLKVAYWSSLAQIGDAINDTVKIYNPYLDESETYSNYMYDQSRSIMSNKETTSYLMNWKPEIKELLDSKLQKVKTDIIVGGTLSDTSEIPLTVFKSMINKKKKVGVQESIGISWDRPKVAKRNEWEFLITGNALNESKDGDTYFDNEKKHSILYKFGDSVSLYGGNTYSFYFDPNKYTLIKLAIYGISGTMLYLWLIL